MLCFSFLLGRHISCVFFHSPVYSACLLNLVAHPVGCLEQKSLMFFGFIASDMRQSVICSPVQEFYDVHDVRLFYVVNGNVSLMLIVLLKLLHPLHRERSTTHHPGVLSLMGCVDGFELLIISGPFMAERRLSQDDFFISAEFHS